MSYYTIYKAFSKGGIHMKGKDILYNTFRKIIETTDYSEIAIKDFVKTANVNRNTFYYHFMDMDSFLKEYLCDEIFYDVEKLIIENKLSEGYNLLIDYAVSNKAGLRNILNSPKGHDVLSYIMRTKIRMDIQKILYDNESRLRIHLPNEFMTFYARALSDEYLRGILQIVLENTKPELLKSVISLYMESIPEKLNRAYRAGIH